MADFPLKARLQVGRYPHAESQLIQLGLFAGVAFVHDQHAGGIDRQHGLTGTKQLLQNTTALIRISFWIWNRLDPANKIGKIVPL